MSGLEIVLIIANVVIWGIFILSLRMLLRETREDRENIERNGLCWTCGGHGETADGIGRYEGGYYPCEDCGGSGLRETL